MTHSIRASPRGFERSRPSTSNSLYGGFRYLLRLAATIALALSVSMSVLGEAGITETVSETANRPLILLKYEELQWQPADVPEGAEFARMIYYAQHLVRWPPGAELPFNTRRSAFHGIVLSGTVVMRVPGSGGSGEHELDPLTMFAIQQETPHGVRCKAPTPCLFYLFGADPAWRDIIDDTLNVEGAYPYHGAWVFKNLIDGQWRDIGESTGTSLDVFKREGYWEAILVNLNVFRLYRLARGTGMPFNNRRVDSIGFVLSGKLVFRTDANETALVPGSFFQVPRSIAYTSRCEEENCVVLTTDYPP